MRKIGLTPNTQAVSGLTYHSGRILGAAGDPNTAAALDTGVTYSDDTDLGAGDKIGRIMSIVDTDNPSMA